MIRLNYLVIYPKVASAACSEPEHSFGGWINTDGDSTKDQLKACDALFDGFGNHPGNDGDVYVFRSGNDNVDKAHARWEIAQTRSMSVGDVVTFPSIPDTYFICDSIGWLTVNKTLADKWLAYPREYGCCSFELEKFLKENALGQYGIAAGGYPQGDGHKA